MPRTPEPLLNHLKYELCLDDAKYRLEDLSEFIPLCTKMSRIELPLVTMTYVYPPALANGELVLFKKVATRVNNLLSQFKFVADPPLEFFIVPHKNKRKFPVNGEQFAVKHINGAFTYRNNRKIYIFRHEEWPKVAIHEACHHLPIHTELWDHQSLMRIYDAFNIDKNGCSYKCSTNIIPNEAVIEYWAEIMHLKYIANEYNIPFEPLLQKEQQHALCKAAKILNYQRRFYPRWREETHAFSYIVLRAIILYYHSEFAKISYPYDSKVLTDFIIDHFNHPAFQHDLHSCKIPRTNDMRMTVFGDM